MSQLRAGDRINNYLLDEPIGVGSFGEVWKAHHHVFDTLVAIKIPTNREYVRNLQREGVAIHGLRHPNIVRALDLDPYSDPPYLIMEYVDGLSLRQLIEQNKDGLLIQTTVAVLDGILMAIEAAHQVNLVHRDIKPANVLIEGGEDLSALTPERVKVTDFGLGRAGGAARESIMQSGSISTDDAERMTGTFAYMSPEQRDGAPVDVRSDLYAVGVVLHEMLTGVLPQGTDLPSSVRRDVPHWLDELFERCYTRLERRFTSAAAIRKVIEQHTDTSRIQPPAIGPNEPRTQRVNGQWRCVGCDGTVEESDQFCIHCGTPLVDHVPRCPSCHAFVGRSDNFCILCGTDLRLES